MEDLIPAIGSFLLPTIVYKYMLLRDPPKVMDRIITPMILYAIILYFIGVITYSIDMKRHCQKFRTERVFKKSLLFVIMVTFIFGFINYIEWPLMYWLNLFASNNELLIVGFFLMICVQLSYYMVKIITSNC